MQQPSSLIFLAIVVIWAGYLLQHWIRRREALATARSVDEFSDAMRVLERREYRLETDDLAEQSEAPTASRPSAPRPFASMPRPSLRAGTVMTGENQRPTTAQPHHEQGESELGQSPVQRFGHLAATAGSPRLRAIALVGSISLFLITVICAPFGALPWWSPILLLAATGAAGYWCRLSAMAAAPAQRRTATRLPQPGRTAAATARPVGRALADHPVAPAVQVTKVTMPAPQAPAAAPIAEQVYDLSAFDAVAAPVAEPAGVSAHADAEGGWRPVAVPRPTYTMKERAPQRAAQPAMPRPQARSYDHVANEDLPFDGLALDQDLDDLPSVFRAG